MKPEPTKIARAAVAVPLLLLALPASAQYFGGIRLDPAKAGVVASEFAPHFFALAVAPPAPTFADKKTGFGLKVGYQFAPLFSLEGHYTEFGKSNHGGAADLKAKSYGLDLAGAMPVFDRFALLGRIGARQLKADGAFASSSIDTFGANLAQTTTAGRVNVGLQYAVTKNLGLNLEVERFRKLGNHALSSAFDADNYSVGLQFKF
jgi:hypothetical protein